MKHGIGHVFSGDDSISFQLAQVLSQHPFGCPRNKPRELTQAYRSRAHSTENLHSPLTLEEHSGRQRSVAYIPCIQVTPNRSTSRLAVECRAAHAPFHALLRASPLPATCTWQFVCIASSSRLASAVAHIDHCSNAALFAARKLSKEMGVR